MTQNGMRPLAPEALARLAAEETDSRVFRTDMLERLRRVVHFEWYAWVLTDPLTTVGVDPLADVPDLSALPRVIQLKYLTTINRWSTLDVAAALGEHSIESPLWRDAQRALGVVDVASVVFRDRYGCWGFLDLWSKREFAPDDIARLRELAPGLTAALRLRQARTFKVVAAGSDRHVAGPVVLLLRDDLVILGQTAASDDWLRVLLPQQSGSSPIPACAYNVAAQVLARESGVDDHEPMARTHLADGFWVTLRASRVEPSNLIAVTIEQSAPDERLDLFARVHGLSDREHQLLGLLAQGSDTAQAASRMFLSPHTIQDHLKSVFTKTGTRSRRVLLSHALGTQGRS